MTKPRPKPNRPPSPPAKPARQGKSRPAATIPPPAETIEARDSTTRPAESPVPSSDPGQAMTEPAGLLPIPTDHGRAVEQLLRWIAKGASPIEQAEALARHYPAANPANVYRDALAQVASLADPHPTLTRGFCFLAAQELHRRAVESGDLSAALRALRFLAQLAATATPLDLPAPSAPATP